MTTNLKRYQLFGWDYDHFSPLNESEINWYKNHARQTGGPILELACGTGRLLSELAGIGYDITGIDLSSKMLEIANANIGKLPAGTKNKITLVEGDITNFDFDRQFGLIFIADNSFRELRAKEAQISCLKAVYRHLSPQGVFLLTVRRFDFSSFANGRREVPWSKPITDPATGHKVSRKVEFTLSDNNQLLNGVYQYKTVDGRGTERFEECPFISPILQEEDYRALFEAVGLKANLFCDFNNQKDIVGQTLCFVCYK